MPFEVSQPAEAGTDMSGAPLHAPAPDEAAQDAAKADAALGSLGLRPAVPGTADPAPAPEVPADVTLATVPPLASVTIPPLEAGGAEIIITAEGTGVDQATALRAHAAAMAGGYRLREL